MAIFSMTGYGRGERTAGAVTVTVEMKSVNHRFLDIACKVPAVYGALEQHIVAQVRDELSRGRVEVSVNRIDAGDAPFQFSFHKGIFRKFLHVAEEAAEICELPVSDVYRQLVPDLLLRREIVELVPKNGLNDAEAELVSGAVEDALDELVRMRTIEGKELERELAKHVQVVEQQAKKLQTRAAEGVKDFQRRLLERVHKLEPGVQLDESRLAQEVALLADRTDVSEELARLRSHFEQFRRIVDQGEGGRKLDFLLQEMNREINTIGSKSQDSAASEAVVEAKAALERVREQVQNIE